VPTNGVEAVKTKGKADSPIVGRATPRMERDFTAVGYVTTTGEWKKGCPGIAEPEGWKPLLIELNHAPRVEAKPLTEEQMHAILQQTAESIDSMNIVMTHWPQVFRAAERAHGIGTQPEADKGVRHG
jgi:hypothetical protein